MIFIFPVFHREIEESLSAEGVVTKGTKFVITEGNYLLHDRDGWEEVEKVLTEHGMYRLMIICALNDLLSVILNLEKIQKLLMIGLTEQMKIMPASVRRN
jgi:hypothetical protein